MSKTIIDINNWNRREHFHAFRAIECSFSVTVNIDVTHALSIFKQKHYKFYPAMIYLITSAVNQSPALKMSMQDETLVKWDIVHPSYTIFHPESETFSALWTYFDISCLPWTSFTGFTLNFPKVQDHFKPIITMGKYQTQSGKTILPLAIQVHHAVCDGFHVAKFIEALQQLCDEFL
ncbi:chloramphenicol acetyltransferase [Ignatzschineria rhizosphaerae]|uniref:Chloramphenicol acetyltransferase n=1 Tax=Ignatzschineria rhizosphaerae TaxID=2923279 RepID=A0ABY3X5Y0_9GAMM|nr:chloramphenicol acetyltransferase [Ignatzschineria rhizosphaerae]UNM97159.1 chloramphenicol acetyltransferase [Ignatzschineria rhizosphaerae]